MAAALCSSLSAAIQPWALPHCLPAPEGHSLNPPCSSPGTSSRRILEPEASHFGGRGGRHPPCSPCTPRPPRQQGGALAPPNPQQLLMLGTGEEAPEAPRREKTKQDPCGNSLVDSPQLVLLSHPGSLPSLRPRPSALSPPEQQDEVGMFS